MISVLNKVRFAVEFGVGLALKPISMWLTSSGATSAASSIVLLFASSGRPPKFTPTDLKARRVRRVGVDAIGRRELQSQLTRRIRVVDVGLERLRPIDAEQLLQLGSRRVRGPTRDATLEVDVFLVVVEAQPRQQVQPIGDRPVDLPEQRRAHGVELRRDLARVAVEERRRRGRRRVRRRPEEAIQIRTGLLRVDGIRVELLIEAEEAEDAAHAIGQIARPTNLLRDLLMLRRCLRQRADGQAEVIAVVRRIPVPEAPGRRRRELARADVDVDVRGKAAHLVAGLPGRIGVDEAIERVAARRLVAEIGDDRLELPVLRALRRDRAREDLRVALRLLVRVVEHERDVHILVRRDEQLRAHAEVVEVVDLLLRRDVVEQAVALRARQRDAAGDLVAERTGDRALRLDEVVLTVARARNRTRA